MHTPANRMTARGRALWLVLVVCLWVHPLLLQVHDASVHACDRDHGHAPALGPTAAADGSSGGSASASCGPHEPASGDATSCASPDALTEATGSADLAAASSPTPPEDHRPGHHCFHCVLCYAAAHTAQAAPLPVMLEVALETHATVEPGEIHGPRAASIAPAAPRAPPSLS